MNPTDLQGPVAITALYFTLWYALLLGLQRGTKYRLIREYRARGEVFDRYHGTDPEMLAADRAVANTLEQMGPFLTTLWLHAVLVSPRSATALGLAYVVIRAIYPFLLGRSVSKTQSKRVIFATGPAYLIILTLGGSTVWTVFTAG